MQQNSKRLLNTVQNMVSFSEFVLKKICLPLHDQVTEYESMTQGLCDLLNIPSIDEIISDENKASDESENVQKTIDSLQELSSRMAMMEGKDHSEAMDELYKEILAHARDLMAYGFNIEQTRARGIFEVASMMYGHAMNAKNSKRDAQIKALRLMLDKRKVDIEEKKINYSIGEKAATINEGTIIVEDRNELIKKLRDEMMKKDD